MNNPERNQQSMDWRHFGYAKPEKCCFRKSAEEVLASIFSECQSVFMINFLDTSRTITKNF